MGSQIDYFGEEALTGIIRQNAETSVDCYILPMAVASSDQLGKMDTP